MAAAEVSLRDVLAFGVYLVGLDRASRHGCLAARGPAAARRSPTAGRGPGDRCVTGLRASSFPPTLCAWPSAILGSTCCGRWECSPHAGGCGADATSSTSAIAPPRQLVLDECRTNGAFGALVHPEQLGSRNRRREAALSDSYVDEPFHLSLAVGLRHVFPPQYPYVADTPLEYHWLSHLHVAAASWVTGTEPAILLSSLTLQILFLVVAFATARVAVRLTGASWTKPATLGAFLVVPASFSGWEADRLEGLLSNRLMASPSRASSTPHCSWGSCWCSRCSCRARRPGRCWG